MNSVQDEEYDLVPSHGLILNPEAYKRLILVAIEGHPIVEGAPDFSVSETVFTSALNAVLEPLANPSNIDILARHTNCLDEVLNHITPLLPARREGEDYYTAVTIIGRCFAVLKAFFEWTVPVGILSQLYKMLRFCWCEVSVELAHEAVTDNRRPLASVIENEIISMFAVVSSKLKYRPTLATQHSGADNNSAGQRMSPRTPSAFLDPLPATYVHAMMNANDEYEKLGRGIILPKMTWPKQGFSCAIWVNLDDSSQSAPKVAAPKQKRGHIGHSGQVSHRGGLAVVAERRKLRECIFKVRTDAGAGFELVREAGALVYTVYNAHGGIGDALRGIKIFNRDFDKIDHYQAGRLRSDSKFPLSCGQWHQIVITHKKPRVGRPTAEVYLDGLVVAEGPLSYPSWDSTKISKAFVAGVVASICDRESAKAALVDSRSDAPLHSLRGRIGPFAVFNKNLALREVQALAHRGHALLCGIGYGGPPLSAYQCRFDPSCLADARAQRHYYQQQVDETTEEDDDFYAPSYWQHVQNCPDAGGGARDVGPAVVYYYQACHLTPLPQVSDSCCDCARLQLAAWPH